MITTTQYCKDNCLSIKPAVFTKLVDVDCSINKQPKLVSYEYDEGGLDNFCIEHNLTCNLPVYKVVVRNDTKAVVSIDGRNTAVDVSNIKEFSLDEISITKEVAVKATILRIDLEKQNKLQVVYLLKAYYLEDSTFTGVCKVGVSNDVTTRVKSLNMTWENEGVYFELYKLSKPKLDALAIERAIHTILRDKDLNAKDVPKLDGHTELFYYDEHIDWFIEK